MCGVAVQISAFWNAQAQAYLQPGSAGWLMWSLKMENGGIWSLEACYNGVRARVMALQGGAHVARTVFYCCDNVLRFKCVSPARHVKGLYYMVHQYPRRSWDFGPSAQHGTSSTLKDLR